WRTMAHDGKGVNVIAWPANLQKMSEVSHADSLQLYERLREHFGLLLVDAGGFSDTQFIASMAQSADAVLLVTDQSIGALISLADTVQSLHRVGIATEQMGLVLNRYDERYGMSANQVAERFGVRLKAVIPDRPLSLRSSMNQGMLLHKDRKSTRLN